MPYTSQEGQDYVMVQCRSIPRVQLPIWGSVPVMTVGRSPPEGSSVALNSLVLVGCGDSVGRVRFRCWHPPAPLVEEVLWSIEPGRDTTR